MQNLAQFRMLHLMSTLKVSRQMSPERRDSKSDKYLIYIAIPPAFGEKVG